MNSVSPPWPRPPSSLAPRTISDKQPINGGVILGGARLVSHQDSARMPQGHWAGGRGSRRQKKVFDSLPPVPYFSPYNAPSAPLAPLLTLHTLSSFHFFLSSTNPFDCHRVSLLPGRTASADLNTPPLSLLRAVQTRVLFWFLCSRTVPFSLQEKARPCLYRTSLSSGDEPLGKSHLEQLQQSSTLHRISLSPAGFFCLYRHLPAPSVRQIAPPAVFLRRSCVASLNRRTRLTPKIHTYTSTTVPTLLSKHGCEGDCSKHQGAR